MSSLSNILSYFLRSTFNFEKGEPLPPKVEELAQASVPTALKGVRACLRCGIVKTLDQFLEYGE